MVALSVSISAITSPEAISSPSFFTHFASVPSVIVGESAGIKTLMGMKRLQLFPSPAGPCPHVAT